MFESYLELVLAALVNIVYVMRDLDNFHRHVDGRINILNFAFTIVCLIFGLFYPIYFVSRLALYKNKATDGESVQVLKENARPKSQIAPYYNIMFLARRLLTIFIVVF